MRTFLAIELPEVLRREIGRRIEGLRDVAPPARWVRPEALHATLIFLGERSPAEIGELAPRWVSGLERAGLGSFELELGAPGAFPPRGPCRTLWLGLRPPEPVAALHGVLVAETRAVLGQESVETRPFHPHVTVARARRPWPRRHLADLEQVLGDLEGSALGRVPVERVALFASELRPDGARYRLVEGLPLGASA